MEIDASYVLQNRPLKFALLAAILAAAASYLLLNNLLAHSQTVVATKKIEAGTIIEQDSVSLKSLPNGSIVPGALRRLDLAIGRKSLVTRYLGDQVTHETVNPSGNSSFSNAIPSGSVLATFNISGSNALLRFVKEGDLVDVIAVNNSLIEKESDAKTVLRRVKLLKVVEGSGSKNLEGGNKNFTIFIAVTLKQAEYLSALEARNSFKLVLESREDSL